jgi:hypothetical protein
MQAGDILTKTEADYIAGLEGFWDMLAEMLEDGRFEDIESSDFRGLVCGMARLKALYAETQGGQQCARMD